MTYLYSFFLPQMDKRIRDLRLNGGMPYVTEAIIIQHFGYKHKDQPELQPHMVELLGITEQILRPSEAAEAINLRDNNSSLKPHPPLVYLLPIKDKKGMAALGSRAVHYPLGSVAIIYIWLARLKRAVASDGHTSLTLTDRNYAHARFSPVVHERLYYQSGTKEETNGGELLKSGVDYHTIALMKGYSLLTFATSATSENGLALGKPPIYKTKDELLTAMDAAWDTLPEHQRKQGNIAAAVGLSERGFTGSMARLSVNYKNWLRGKKVS